MRFRMGGCGPGGFEIPAAIFAMGMGPRGRHGSGRGDWGDWGGNWGRHGRGGRARRMFDSGELRLVLLKLLADQPRHGYDLIRAIEEMTGGAYAPSPGVVYPTLTMLQDMGHIEEQAAEGSRKAFAATAEGEAWLAERKDEADALIARLTGLGEEKKKTGGAPIGRAVGNLLSALWHRVTREDTDEDRLHEIAAILDEAAQRIERLK
ncbi:MAG: transcriptional regulator PadR-like family protein [Alphaproteobacteria bacterium]|nr:transcriptional regulator PadR-like family protein [Alphaproteobacteria bacterium]